VIVCCNIGVIGHRHGVVTASAAATLRDRTRRAERSWLLEYPPRESSTAYTEPLPADGLRALLEHLRLAAQVTASASEQIALQGEAAIAWPQWIARIHLGITALQSADDYLRSVTPHWDWAALDEAVAGVLSAEIDRLQSERGTGPGDAMANRARDRQPT
jgi:hypothetical protein